MTDSKPAQTTPAKTTAPAQKSTSSSSGSGSSSSTKSADLTPEQKATDEGLKAQTEGKPQISTALNATGDANSQTMPTGVAAMSDKEKVKNRTTSAEDEIPNDAEVTDPNVKDETDENFGSALKGVDPKRPVSLDNPPQKARALDYGQDDATSKEGREARAKAEKAQNK